jgi:hypothetical protein
MHETHPGVQDMASHIISFFASLFIFISFYFHFILFYIVFYFMFIVFYFDFMFIFTLCFFFYPQSCDTFLKIAQKCKKKFVQLQPSESSPFIEEILMTLSSILSELTPSQVFMSLFFCFFLLFILVCLFLFYSCLFVCFIYLFLFVFLNRWKVCMNLWG